MQRPVCDMLENYFACIYDRYTILYYLYENILPPDSRKSTSLFESDIPRHKHGLISVFHSRSSPFQSFLQVMKKGEPSIYIFTNRKPISPNMT